MASERTVAWGVWPVAAVAVCLIAAMLVRPARSATTSTTATGGAAGHRKSGIGLFPPAGTDPPKAGIIVPDGFELPPGYVRHYQTTDDGKQLPPILMFHPDFHPVDEHGRPIPLPADRVVPPEMAPPGMPHDVLRVPPH